MSTPPASKIVSAWYVDSSGGHDKFGLIDIGEPECWACGKWFDYNENIKPLQRWNDVDVNLERAHIRARSLGGSDKPRNLCLLCPECHKESPDTKSRELFFTWVNTEDSFWSKRAKQLNDLLERFGLFDKNPEDIISLLEKEEVKERFLEDVTTHGGQLSKSSLVAFVAENL